MKIYHEYVVPKSIPMTVPMSSFSLVSSLAVAEAATSPNIIRATAPFIINFFPIKYPISETKKLKSE